MAVKAAEVASKGVSIYKYEPSSPVARAYAIRLSKYNCSVRVEDEYHTEHGQAALRRDFNFDSPVTQ